MILSLLLLMGMQPCHRVGSELKNCGMLYGDFPNTVAVTVQGAVLNTEEWCGNSITLGKSSKKFSEIFPEECKGDLVHIHGTDHQDDLFQRAAPNGCIDPCYEAPPQPGLIGDSYEMLHPSEPLDVPAIQVSAGAGVIAQTSCPPLADGTHGPGGMWCSSPALPTVYGCADKTRILEHDEQPFPHTLYWCRKVQTGGKP